MKYKTNIISHDFTVQMALERLNNLLYKYSLTLFVIDENQKLIGTVTDGDIRRGLLNGVSLGSNIQEIMHTNYRFLQADNIDFEQIKEFKKKEIVLIPVIDSEGEISRIVNLNHNKTILPLDAVIIAGGEGRRLRPLTENTPKPLLKVGDKPIIEYNIDRLNYYGVHRIHITIKYLGEQIVNYFGDGQTKALDIRYIREKEMPLGTIGSLALIDNFVHDHLLVMNSDLLTNIDFEDMYNTFVESNADMIVATIPYQVKVPYGVLETEHDRIVSLKEKPTYTYYSNAGIYMLKKELVKLIPKHEKYDATDLMTLLMADGHKVVQYPILGYWLDIGKPEDFQRAQEDVKHLQLF